MSELDDLRVAWQAGELGEALRLALGVWRRSRSAPVAEVVLALGAEAPPWLSRPEGAAAFDALWHARLDDLVARGPALSHLTHRLPGHYPEDWRAALIRRLVHLATLEPDPRVGVALVALLDDAPPELLNQAVQAHLLAVAQRHVDERTHERLLELGEVRAPAVVPLPAAERAAWQALLDQRPIAHHPTWDAVRADPDDDEALGVLADELLERDDPRGEFISLQLKEARGQASEAEAARAHALLLQHHHAFLDGLERVTLRAQFRRGLLHRLELDGPLCAPEAEWRRAAVHPSLRSVEALPPGNAGATAYARFVCSPTMTHLRALMVWDDVTLAALEATAAPVQHVSCLRWPEPTFASALLPVLERLPRLTSLALAPSMVSAVRASPMLARVKTVVVGRLPYALTLRGQLPDHVTIQCGDAVLAPCLPTRDAEATLSTTSLTLEGPWLASVLLHHLDRLPASVTTLRLRGPLDQALVDAAKARSLNVEVAPAAPIRGCVAVRV